jgi:hypothetical protein
VENSCECGSEPFGYIIYWRFSSGFTTCVLGSDFQLDVEVSSKKKRGLRTSEI